MKLVGKRIIAGILVFLACFCTIAGAMAESHAVNTEENGRITETIWQNEQGDTVSGPDGYAIVRYTYKRDSTTEKYFDPEGEPCMAAGGYYQKTVTKDGKGNIVQIEYMDANGERMLNALGYGMVTISYYGFGDERMITYYGLGKRPVIVPSLGYASVVNLYSSKTLTNRIYRDEKGNPVDNADGYAEIKKKLNKRYQVLVTRYDHADGSPATGPDGWFRCLTDRDDKGRVTSIKYYDTENRLMDRGNGYAWEGYAYEGENIVKVTRYSLDDLAVEDEAGIVTVVREMKDGKIVRECFLDKDGKRVNNKNGVGGIRYAYDLQGALEKVSYEDTEGNTIKCEAGYAGYRDTKDEDGATVSRTFLGTDGLAIEIPGGYSEIRYFYDDTKQLTATRYYDINGKQVAAE